MKRLVRHSAIYGAGGLVSRILATILLPLYLHFLPPSAYGQVEIITAATAVLAILLQLGISSAFFRFYFDAKENAAKLTVIRTSFWFTMGAATIGLVVGLAFAPQISHLLGLGDAPWLVRAGAVGLWAQTNYQQLTALFRVEERSTAYAVASVTNVIVTVAAMVLFVAVFHWGAIGLIVGNFTGTLLVYLALVLYRTEQLGLEFDRDLFRRMQKFGMPLVPAALALWVINFVDREFVVWYRGLGEAGIYSAAVKIASVITFVMIAFRTAWPAFAYSIEDDREAKRAYAFVLTYLLAFASWGALALGALAPWWTKLLTAPKYQSAEEGVALLGVRRRRLRRLHGACDRQRPGAAHAAELGRHGRRRGREHRVELLADPGVRMDRRGDLDARGVRRALCRHDPVRAERLPRALPVAARGDRPRCRRRVDDRAARRRVAAASVARLRRDLSARPGAARLLPPRRASEAQAAPSRAVTVRA